VLVPLRPTFVTSVVAVALALVVTACSSAGSSRRSSEQPLATTAPTSAAATPTDASAGCGNEPDVAPVGDDRPGDVPQTITIDGLARTYRLGVPGSYDPAEPAPPNPPR